MILMIVILDSRIAAPKEMHVDGNWKQSVLLLSHTHIYISMMVSGDQTMTLLQENLHRASSDITSITKV